MWKAFVSALLALVLQGCASSAGSPGGGPAPEAPPVSERSAALFERANGALQDARWIEAETLLLEITADQPELAGPWYNLARALIGQGREEDAVTALQRAVAASPDHCAAHSELGVLLRRRGEFAAAEAHYLACLERRPDYAPALLNLGILYELYLGRLDEALAAYERYQALAADPDQRVGAWLVDLRRRVDS